MSKNLRTDIPLTEEENFNEIDEKCPRCVGRCDCSTISDCDKCGTPHCKNCQYED